MATLKYLFHNKFKLNKQYFSFNIIYNEETKIELVN